MNTAVVGMTHTIEDFKQAIKDEFRSLGDSLGGKLDSGFKDVSSELKGMREQGHIPVNVMQTIIDSNNSTYKSIIHILCWTFGMIIASLITLKIVFPNLFT